jgi:hypothetical protein
MPVILSELPVQSVSGRTVRVFRIGLRSNGTLETVGDLVSALEWIHEGDFPPIRLSGRWILRRYIIDPSSEDEVPVATISTPAVFTIRAFRELGAGLLESAIQAVESGSLSLTNTGSDVDSYIDPLDLAYLHNALEKNETRGYFTLIGSIS